MLGPTPARSAVSSAPVSRFPCCALPLTPATCSLPPEDRLPANNSIRISFPIKFERLQRFQKLVARGSVPWPGDSAA